MLRNIRSTLRSWLIINHCPSQLLPTTSIALFTPFITTSTLLRSLPLCITAFLLRCAQYYSFVRNESVVGTECEVISLRFLPISSRNMPGQRCASDQQTAFGANGCGRKDYASMAFCQSSTLAYERQSWKYHVWDMVTTTVMSGTDHGAHTSCARMCEIGASMGKYLVATWDLLREWIDRFIRPSKLSKSHPLCRLLFHGDVGGKPCSISQIASSVSRSAHHEVTESAPSIFLSSKASTYETRLNLD